MLTTQHKKEAFSRTYVRALATVAGVNLRHPEFDYGLDIGFSEIKRREDSEGPRYCDGVEFRAQVKCSHNIVIEKGNIIFDLESKNYNDLVDDEINIPRILVLVHVPQNETDWVSCGAEELILKKCAYWHYIQGASLTPNSGTKRIKFPSSQLFTASTINQIIENIKNGQPLI